MQISVQATRRIGSHLRVEETVMARLLSVNVGLPRDLAWQGKTVHTGIWKAPVEGPRRVRRLNIDGDGQGDTAGHGGEQRAVFVYQDEVPIGTGRNIWGDRISFMVNSARTSPSKALPTPTCASETATGSAPPCSR